MLLHRIENPSALLAPDNLAPALYAVRGLGGDLHVAAGADFMLQRDDRGVAFAGEETLKPVQHVFIDLARNLASLLCEAGQTLV